MKLNPLFCLALVPLVIFPLAGCAQPNNDRLALGGVYISPTFRSQTPITIAEPSPSNPPLLSSTPKPRSAWKPVQYISPFDGAAHTPLLRVLPPINRKDMPRNYRRYPTINDALDEQSNTFTQNLSFAIKEMGRSFFGTPLAFGYFLSNAQLATPSITPDRSWKRTTQDGWSSGFPAQTPAAQQEVPRDAH